VRNLSFKWRVVPELETPKIRKAEGEPSGAGKAPKSSRQALHRREILGVLRVLGERDQREIRSASERMLENVFLSLHLIASNSWRSFVFSLLFRIPYFVYPLFFCRRFGDRSPYPPPPTGDFGAVSVLIMKIYDVHGPAPIFIQK